MLYLIMEIKGIKTVVGDMVESYRAMDGLRVRNAKETLEMCYLLELMKCLHHLKYIDGITYVE